MVQSREGVVGSILMVVDVKGVVLMRCVSLRWGEQGVPSCPKRPWLRVGNRQNVVVPLCNYSLVTTTCRLCGSKNYRFTPECIYLWKMREFS